MSVTEQDRVKAAELLLGNGGVGDGGWESRALAIAAALADERERARAPFLALADEYDLIPLDHAEARRIVRKVADRIRRAAEEDQ